MAMKNYLRICIAALFALTTGCVVAQENILSEVRVGVMAHAAHPKWVAWDVSLFNLNQVEDVSFDVLFRSPDIDAFRWIGSPRPNLGATINLDGQESMAHLGLTWQTHIFDSPVYLEGTFGVAVHDGVLTGPLGKLRPQGCRFQFYSAAGIGIDIDDRFTATLVYEHMSNAELCTPNYGLSNLGIKIGAKF